MRTRKNKPAPIPPSVPANADNNSNATCNVSPPPSNIVTPAKEKTTSTKLSVQSSSKKTISAEFSPQGDEDGASFEELSPPVSQSDGTSIYVEDGK